jgi:hypothetical protein
MRTITGYLPIPGWYINENGAFGGIILTGKI